MCGSGKAARNRTLRFGTRGPNGCQAVGQTRAVWHRRFDVRVVDIDLIHARSRDVYGTWTLHRVPDDALAGLRRHAWVDKQSVVVFGGGHRYPEPSGIRQLTKRDLEVRFRTV